ncbi:MAG: hypothetical protein WBB50_13280 [Methyloceanibacter sp.]
MAHSIKKKMGDRSPTPFDDDSSGGCFAKALEARGISYEYLHRHQTPIGSMPHRKYLVFRVNGVAHYFSHGSLLVGNTDGSVGPSVNGAIGPLLAQKDLTNSVLRGHGFSVPEGLAFHRDSTDEACGYFAALAATAARGVCVKPANGRKGHKVHVGLRDLPSFRSAFKLVAKHYERVLIEETVEGAVYRFFCLAGRAIAIRYGLPANVEGDGVHSIADLVQLKNRTSADTPSRRRIRVKQPEERMLVEKGMAMSTIPRAGEIVWLGRTSNLHQGADTIDATDTVHPSYIAIVEQAVQRFPGLTLCGADVVIADASVAATASNHHFLELNDDPGFAAHHHPLVGNSRDVAGAIVEYLMLRDPG